MTKKILSALVDQIEESLEGQTNASLIISIGRAQNQIMIDKKFPYVEILAEYVRYVTPFLHQAVMAEEYIQ